MSRTARFAAPLALTLIGAALSVAPAATAEPPPVLPGSGPADQIVNELQALGYTVSINWTNGQDSSPPLSGCRVISFHNPDRSGQSAPQDTTIYVDVVCPNESED